MLEDGRQLEALVQEFSATHDEVLLLSAGDETEALAAFIANELSDDELDHVDISRDLERRDDLASEPVTVAVLIGLGSTVAVVVGRIIERWLERKRQREQIELLVGAYKQSKDAGESVAQIVRTHAAVSIQYNLADPPSSPN